ncbi:SEL1-like repeat protein [Helicobacter sp. 11S03491-1]|nr:SEL1-like repeat protein [Helicobacter sp. 11S03491-1]
MYFDGKCVKQDYHKAKELYQKACNFLYVEGGVAILEKFMHRGLVFPKII